MYFEKGQYEDARTYYMQALQLREKSKVTEDIVDTIHNLAETSVQMGDYDQAFSQYMRALELRRSMNDTRGAAIESYTLGDDFGLSGAVRRRNQFQAGCTEELPGPERQNLLDGRDPERLWQGPHPRRSRQ